MDHVIKSKYLVFPVNALSSKKNLFFKKNGKTLYTLEIKLDYLNPDFYAYIDVSRFMGEQVSIYVEPEMAVRFTETDEMCIEGLYHETMRPQIHFTTKNGWMNDPNGLLYLDGVYHMFYQHNPAEVNWGNMHWGHAVSPDLIHWEEKDIALFPDERGAMFSGCAILDEHNLLGLIDGENKAALLYYTTTSPFCQYLSYSTDQFRTIHQYGNKPVIDHIAADNRDPSVIYCEELGCYILALYLEEDRYILFRSSNLTDWEEIQQFHMPGDNECPDIFVLKNEADERKWVIIGAHDKYLVGHFDSGKFVADQPIQTLHYGTAGYAGQSYNLPNGRTVRMVWDHWHLPATAFNGQMGIPMELSLIRCGNIHYLQANPIQEVETLYKDTQVYRTVAVSPEGNFQIPLESCAHLVKLRSEHRDTGKLKVRIFGITVEFDFTANRLTLGECTAPISVTGNGLDVTLIIDRCSAEIFADGGTVFLSCLNSHTFSDYNLPNLSIESTESIPLDHLEIHPMHSIWNA